MALFSDDEIKQLIECSKGLSEAPAKMDKLVDADWRNGAKLVPEDGTAGTFSMFMRRNDDFPENFSVGLKYVPVDGRSEIILLRCNGKHGVFTGHGDATHPHWDYHIHRASEAAQDAGFAPEKYARVTEAYASYEQAIQYFVTAVNLNAQEATKHFPNKSQGNLFLN